MNITLENVFGEPNRIYERHGIATTKPSDFQYPNSDEVTFLKDVKSLDTMLLGVTNQDQIPQTDQCNRARSPYLLSSNHDNFFFTSESTSSVECKQSPSPKHQSIDFYSNVSPIQNSNPSQSNLSFDCLSECMRTFDAQKEHSTQWNDGVDLTSSSHENNFNLTNEIDIDFETISILQSVLNEIDLDAAGQINDSDPTSNDTPKFEYGQPVSSYQNTAQQKPIEIDSEHCVTNKSSISSIPAFKSCARDVTKNPNNNEEAQPVQKYPRSRIGRIKTRRRRGKKDPTNIIKWIYDLLCREDQRYNDIVKWINRSKLEFRIEKQHKLASLWGQLKRNPKMNFNKFA